MSLNDICFENIKDNFWYGKYGEFTIIVDKNTGCFNATKLCKLGKKEFKNWTRLYRTLDFMNYYDIKISTNSANFYEIKADNKKELDKLVTGQYVQKEFILDIASWISPEFYHKCTCIINDYFINEYKKELTELQIQLTKQERFNNKLKDIVVTMKERQKDQIIYIATTKAYANQNRFKVGGVKSRNHLKSRLSSYNSGRPSGDKMYFAFIKDTTDYRHLEQRVSKILGDHKDKAEAEVYNVHYDSLQPIINYLADRFDEEITYHKKLFENLVKETLEKEPTIPEPLLLNGAEFRTLKNGEVVLTQKIDFDNMTDEEKKDYVYNSFEQFIIFNSSLNLNRKDFEDFLLDSGCKFRKLKLWSFTKDIAKEFNREIKF